MKTRKLNFYNQNTRNAIKSWGKTIETRALNPEEPERYFGDIRVWDQITFTNKLIWNSEIRVKVTKVYQRKNFEELRNEDKNIVRKMYSNPEKFDKIKTLAEFKQWRDCISGYIEKVEKNGLVWWKFEMIG